MEAPERDTLSPQVGISAKISACLGSRRDPRSLAVGETYGQVEPKGSIRP